MKGRLLILNTVISNSRRRTQTTNGKKPKQFEIQEPYNIPRRFTSLGKKGRK